MGYTYGAAHMPGNREGGEDNNRQSVSCWNFGEWHGPVVPVPARAWAAGASDGIGCHGCGGLVHRDGVAEWGTPHVHEGAKSVCKDGVDPPQCCQRWVARLATADCTTTKHGLQHGPAGPK